MSLLVACAARLWMILSSVATIALAQKYYAVYAAWSLTDTALFIMFKPGTMATSRIVT